MTTAIARGRFSSQNLDDVVTWAKALAEQHSIDVITGLTIKADLFLMSGSVGMWDVEVEGHRA